MEIKDLILTPLFLFFLVLFFYFFKGFFADKEDQPLFLRAFFFKIIGAFAFAFIYQFYYGYGDTFMYHDGIKNLYELTFEDPYKAWTIFNGTATEANHYFNSTHLVNRTFYLGEAEFMVIKFGYPLSFLGGNAYLIVGILFAVYCFIGVWYMFKLLSRLFPSIKGQLALGILFFPSILFWSSGILKDSIAFGAMGLVFYSGYYLIIRFNRAKLVQNLIVLTLNGILLLSVKGYVVMLLIPSMMIWKYFRIQKSFAFTSRLLISPFLAAVGAIAIYFSINNIVDSENRFSAENIINTAQYQAYHLQKESKGNASYYEIGTFDGSFGSLIRNGPLAIFTALFRPFIWEARNPVMLLSGLENLVVLIIFLTGIRKLGFINYFRVIFKSPFLMYALIFSLAFSLSVGLTGGNFGSLVRYKIPALPFFISAILVLNNTSKITPEALRI